MLVVDEPSDLDAFRALGAVAGWTHRDGFSLPSTPWALEEARVLCVGVVASAAEARAVVEAVSRGAAVAACVTLTGRVRQQLLEDLHRVGTVEARSTHLHHAVRPDAQSLTPEQRDLLDALVDGCTITEAASLLHLSRRTATRRLAECRDRLGLATTAEAMTWWVAARQAASAEERR